MLIENQIESAENFIKSLPDSIAKGNYERWLAQVHQNGRLPSYDLEKFIALSSALPVEFQSFPQTFALAVKNGLPVEESEDGDDSEATEGEEKTTTKKVKKASKKK